ncbi:PAAR-like protein [Gilliamella sp. Choc3-5]|uniref:PAAR-like protein n=1 Tax=Gilliamella sp. Choc3-5 TaxID=3120236 RepID=UPI002100128F|nr:PAAR-like protein [Gilliamella apicola]
MNGCKVCTAADKIPITNIPAFGICQKTQQPCVPVPLEWKDTYKVKVKGNQTLLYKSTLPCSLGGKIEFITSGQIPVSREDLDKLTEENAEDPPQEEGLSWWDAVEIVPFAGGVVGMVRSGIKGDWVGFGLSAAFLALDIGGLFSFGAGNAASAAVKTAKLAKAASKVGKAASKISKAALTAGGKLLTKASAKVAAKALAKKADDIAIRYGKVCVFACFPAGTPVHTQQGIKKIEQIREGDRVWSQNPTGGEISLKKVTAIIRKQIDTTVQIELEGETIETTAEHPFYTKQGWKDAADLTEQDHIQTKNKK